MNRLGPMSPIWLCRCAGPISMVAIGMLSLLPGELRPHVFASSQLEHFLAYFIVAFLCSIGFGNRTNVLRFSLTLPIYAAVLETVQIFIPGRSSRVIDFFVSSAGAWTGILLASLLWSAYLNKSRQPRAMIETVETKKLAN